MKKSLCLAAWMLCLLLVSTGCKTQQEGRCHIYGKMESGRWDGKKIFLVPMFGMQDAEHVDSVVVRDGKFEFTADTVEMKVIRLDYHFRDGVQDLLVVTEPGEVQVTIGANSTTAGTPQNDSLQAWKDQLMRYNVAYNRLRLQATPGASDSLMARGREIQQALRNYIKVFKARQPEGELKKFLVKMYPTL